MIFKNTKIQKENIEIKLKYNPVFSNILKYEKNNYKTFSELQNKSIYNQIKNKRKNNYSTNRSRSISINNKSNISNNIIFKENSNHSNDKEYIIDLDKNVSKINNSYLN